VAFQELKQRQSVMWGNGPYERITATINDIHDLVVERIAPKPGDRWLDLACGTGAVAERAARAGADVTGIDLAPALIETATEKAAEAGLDISYEVGDCEDLQAVESGSFDVVSSTCGVMFAPDHEATARELARVVRQGGKLALANWTPEGSIGAMFKMMAPFAPPPAPGAGSPFAWGDREHIEQLLGDAYDLTFEEHISVLAVESGEEYWQLFSSSYGPTKTLAESLDDERREEFHQAWVDHMDSRYRSGDRFEQPREYLLVLGARR
jgi:ubiquinone/menaquinone biosynthesis C-methylase UbiE